MRQLESIVEIWDATTGKQLMTEATPANGAALQFSPDGTHFATGDYDGAVRLWNAKTGTQDVVLQASPTPLTSLAFSPDGRRIASIDEDGLVRVWALDLDDLVALAEHRLTRGFSDDECRQYLHLDGCQGA